MNFFLKLYCHLRSSLFQFTFGTRLELNYAHLWFHSSKWHHVSTQLQCSWTFIMHIFSSIRFVSLTIPTIFFGRYSHFIFSMVAHWLQLPQYNTIFFIFVPSSMLHTHTQTIQTKECCTSGEKEDAVTESTHSLLWMPCAWKYCEKLRFAHPRRNRDQRELRAICATYRKYDARKCESQNVGIDSSLGVCIPNAW